MDFFNKKKKKRQFQSIKRKIVLEVVDFKAQIILRIDKFTKLLIIGRQYHFQS